MWYIPTKELVVLNQNETAYDVSEVFTGTVMEVAPEKIIDEPDENGLSLEYTGVPAASSFPKLFERSPLNSNSD
jgi:hypothetical protein